MAAIKVGDATTHGAQRQTQSLRELGISLHTQRRIWNTRGHTSKVAVVAAAFTIDSFWTLTRTLSIVVSTISKAAGGSITMAGFQSFPTSTHTAMNKFFSLYGSRLLAVFVLQSWTWLPAMLMFSKYKALYETSGLDCSHSEAAFKTISDWNQRSQNEPKFVHSSLDGDGKMFVKAGCQSQYLWLRRQLKGFMNYLTCQKVA